MISLIYCTIQCLYQPIFVSFAIKFIKIVWKALVIVIPFLSFKGITHAYLLKISITHNKKQITLLNLLVKYISAKSTPQMLSIKGKYTFLFWDFLIIGLCNFSANYWFEIFSFLIPLPEFFLSKVYRPLKQTHIDIHHILDF